MSAGKLRTSGGDIQIETGSKNEDTKRVLRASSAVIENEDGHTVGMVSVLSDITKQRELDAMKTRFVANVSHELRSPLVAIQKSLQLILGREVGDLNPDQERFLDIAHRNIDRLSRLINDVLDISKLEAGRVDMRPSEFPVQEVMRQVSSMLDTWMSDKKIHCELQAPPEAVTLEADMDRVTQVLTNLMSNAIKFTPDGGRIDVSARLIDEPGGTKFVELSVQDSGPGIPKESLEKIFEKFVQLELANSGGISSSGLGLTITREIVEAHHGKIWAESEPGQGSRFVARFPQRFAVQPKGSP
jgi:signal transduction histidine kinase